MDRKYLTCESTNEITLLRTCSLGCPTMFCSSSASATNGKFKAFFSIFVSPFLLMIRSINDFSSNIIHVCIEKKYSSIIESQTNQNTSPCMSWCFSLYLFIQCIPCWPRNDGRPDALTHRICRHLHAPEFRRISSLLPVVQA